MPHIPTDWQPGRAGGTLITAARLINMDGQYAEVVADISVGGSPMKIALDQFYVPANNPTFTGTVTGVTKAMVGLGSVDNTADSAKPVSTAQATALALKAPLASPAFTGTPTGITKAHVGLGSVDNTADTAKPVSTAQATAIALKANLASPAFTGTPTGITAAHVGLGNVTNTSDANKPVSTAQAMALALKVNNSSLGAASGVATLGSDGKVTPAQLPASVAPPGNSEGTYAARPAASGVVDGTIYYATDVPEAYRAQSGVWRVVQAGGNELAAALSSADFTTSASATAKVDVTGLSVTFVVGERPILLRFAGLLVGAGGVADLVIDGVSRASAGGNIPAGLGFMSFERSIPIRGLVPGSTHTYKIMLGSVSGAVTLSGSSANPPFISVVTL